MVYNLSTGHPMSDICPICPKCGSTQIFNDECLERSQFECEITDAKGASIDGNDGFVIHADLRQKKLQMKTIIYCAFNESDAYTGQFLGKDENLIENQEEVRKLIRTFSFRNQLF